MSIFESLDNLNVSEECLSSIIKIIENVLESKKEKQDYSKMGPFAAIDNDVNDFFKKSDEFIKKMKEYEAQRKKNKGNNGRD